MLPFRLVRLHVVAHRVINIEIRVRNANIETRIGPNWSNIEMFHRENGHVIIISRYRR